MGRYSAVDRDAPLADLDHAHYMTAITAHLPHTLPGSILVVASFLWTRSAAAWLEPCPQGG